MSVKCLLLETKEKSKFFTFLKNKKQLKQYCKAFGTKMFIVKAKINKNKILEMSKLVSLFCDKDVKKEKVDFEIIEKIIL